MLNIQKQFISYNRSVRTQSIKYIVIHSTGNVGDTAQNNHDYFASGNRGASADFFVDDNNIIQIIDNADMTENAKNKTSFTYFQIGTFMLIFTCTVLMIDPIKPIINLTNTIV